MVSVSFLCSLLVLSVNLVFGRRVGVIELNVSFLFWPFFFFLFCSSFCPVDACVCIGKENMVCCDFINIKMFSCDSDE